MPFLGLLLILGWIGMMVWYRVRKTNRKKTNEALRVDSSRQYEIRREAWLRQRFEDKGWRTADR